MSLLKLKTRFKNGAAYLEDVYGGAAIIMALMTPIIIGGLAFGAEVGGWEMTKRKLQNAADVAAFAAATQLRSGKDVATMTAAAKAVAETSGYVGGDPGIAVESPPSTAPLAVDGTDPNGKAAYVYVTLTQTDRRVFTRYFARGSDTVSFSTAAIAHIQNGRPACVLALHPSASGAVSTGGSTNVSLSGCDIAANSISQTAITSTGNGSSVTADCISAVGSISVNSTYNLACPAPISNGPVTADPYANVPSPTSCDYTGNTNNFTQSGNPSTPAGSGAIRCYSGAANSWNFNRSISLAPNVTYVLENTSANQVASLQLTGGKTITGANVTLHFKGKWNIKLVGNSTIDITAPTSGTYAGLALFGSRSSEVDMDLSGNNGAHIVGAVYSPNKDSDITYTGSNVAYSSGQCTQVIGGTVTFWGNSNFTTNCSNSGTKEIKAAQSIKIVG
ncbi:MAG: pilus assembly protein TadG-related protein [Parvularculaceae bacterium]